MKKEPCSGGLLPYTVIKEVVEVAREHLVIGLGT